ncbi:hypothetical protein DM02DRAFT_728334 [Periconia macrospinosa]|uniref:WD40 repeat-like protein n=1 Tax=Periconia macrospinosa TaxID=97972 RepID=A0A2V1DRS9_9PLEO|nr:hypothetical protein DM02DRAFT_728334 [Periconia macrospinosa]
MSLNTSIQAYRIPTGELLPPLRAHPSPPNVLAISKDGNILLSASPSPPVVFIQSLQNGPCSPVNVYPPRAISAVTHAAFYPDASPGTTTRVKYILGFQDGSLAYYQLTIPLCRTLDTDTVHAPPMHPHCIGYIEKLHKAAVGGVKAAEFLPGYKCRVVTVGLDGRCRLVDFEGGGQVLRTWHVSGPANCLAIVFNSSAHYRLGKGSIPTVIPSDEPSETLIAIGTESGSVKMYNVLGIMVRENKQYSGPIVALQAVGSMSAPAVLPKQRRSLIPGRTSKRNAEPTVLTLERDETPGIHSESTESVVRKSRPASPVKFDGVRDFFCADTNDHPFIHRPPSRRPKAPERVPSAKRKPRHKSFTRPRLAAETFQSPNLASSQASLTTTKPEATTSAIKPTDQFQNIQKQSIDVYNVFFADALRSSSNSSPSPASGNSGESVSEDYVTPLEHRSREPTQMATSKCKEDNDDTEPNAISRSATNDAKNQPHTTFLDCAPPEIARGDVAATAVVRTQARDQHVRADEVDRPPPIPRRSPLRVSGRPTAQTQASCGGEACARDSTSAKDLQEGEHISRLTRSDRDGLDLDVQRDLKPRRDDDKEVVVPQREPWMEEKAVRDNEEANRAASEEREDRGTIERRSVEAKKGGGDANDEVDVGDGMDSSIKLTERHLLRREIALLRGEVRALRREVGRAVGGL